MTIMRMKTSINLSIDPETGEQAKQWARSHNTSLSSVVESYLKELTAGDENTFSDRWRGRFQLKETSGPRADALKNRYSL